VVFTGKAAADGE